MSSDQLDARTFGLGARNPRKGALLRVSIAVYLFAATASLAAARATEPWAWVTGVFAVIHLILAHRLVATAKRRPAES